jgi:repressor of nif and glnA expression
MSEEINEMQRKILGLIAQDARRAASITRLLKKRGLDCISNDVVQALNDLDKRGLVERASEKAWVATGKGQDYVE